MKLLGVINDNNYLEYLNTGLDGIIFPLLNYSVDYNKYYSLDDIREYKNNTNKECFIVINKMIFNSELDKLLDVLYQIEKLNIDGVFFYDLALLQLVKENNLNINLILNQTHMTASSDLINFYYDNGVKGAYLSNEITKDEITLIKGKTRSELFILLVGKVSAAMSKRKLLTAYFTSKNKNIKDEIIIKEPSSGQEFIVKEDKFGTTFFFNKRLNASSCYLHFREIGINYGIINQDEFDSNTYKKLIENFVNFNKKGIDEIASRNRGFLYRKTIYKVKK